MILIEDGTLYKKEKEKSKLRIGGGSWSINLDIVDIIKVKQIVYETEKHKYTIDANKALDVGFVRHLGGEKKLIVPIEYWEKG